MVGNNRARGRFSRKVALLAAASLFLSPSIAAAQNTVTGRVTDTNGAVLPGAEVIVQETGQRVVADRQGRFIVPSLPEGQATLVINYLGVQSGTRTVNVTPGTANDVQVVLEPAQEGNVIVVRGSILDSTARALNQQRNADNTTNIVSSDAIGRFPDNNIAEALQRVPGFGVERDQGEGNFISIRGAPSEFTAITVDGVSLPSTSPDTRAVDLGSVPSDVVSSIEVSKTLLPSQEADSIAGAVNLTTRSPFDSKNLRITANGGASYNEYGDTSDYRFGGTISETFGNFGVLLSGSLAQTNRKVDNFESIWDVVETPEGEEILGVPEQEYKDYDTRRERLSLTGALEFRPDNVSKFFVRSTWTRRTDDENRNLLAVIYSDGELQDGATQGRATWDDVRIEKEFRHRIMVDESLIVSAGGEHESAGLGLDYTMSYARSTQTYPLRAQLRFRSSARPTVSQDFVTNPDMPAISLFETGEHLDVSRYAYRETALREQPTEQDELAFQTNFRVPLTADATLQFGGRIRLRDVQADNDQWRDRSSAASWAAQNGSMADYLTDRTSQNFDYLLGQKFNSQLVGEYFTDSEGNVKASPRIPDSINSDYRVSEDIFAGYAMTRVEMGSVNLILGARVEHTRFEGNAQRFNEDTGTAVPQHVSRSYTDFFPNLTLRVALTDSLIARAAATRAISRPNYRDIVPRVSEADSGFEVELGNPNLRPTLSNNLDAGLEYYFRPLGMISANVFYKDLEDYSFEIRDGSGSYDGRQNVLLIQKMNAPDGYIFGAELAVQAQATFLPGALSGFGVFGNVAYADAKMTLPGAVPGRAAEVTLPNQSEWTYNAAIFYEWAGFNARLAYTKRSDYRDEFDYGNADLDTYWEGREQLDLTASYDFTDNFNLFLEAKNLTNTPGVRYAGDRSRVTEYEKFGRLFFVGARVKL